MTSAYSWPSLSAAAGFGCLCWCQPPCVSGLGVWSLRVLPGSVGEALFPLLLCVMLCVHAAGEIIASAVALLKLPPPSVAGSCFQACQQATGLCQTRTMMWHFCQWRWSQVRLLSPSHWKIDGGKNGEKGMSPGRKNAAVQAPLSHRLCLGQAPVTQTATQPFFPCQWRHRCPLQGSGMWVWWAQISRGPWSAWWQSQLWSGVKLF